LRHVHPGPAGPSQPRRDNSQEGPILTNPFRHDIRPSALRHVACAALACLALILPAPAQSAYMIPGGTIRPKDFTMVKKDGIYHLFFILHNNALSQDSTERSFGHAISNDLYHWTQQPPVFFVNPDGWDNAHIWAPSIIEYGGLYCMFYTGVTLQPGVFNGTQRTGLAVSSDLVTWNRVQDEPIFDANQTPWGWWQPQEPTPAFRDPFVMRSPIDPSYLLMYYTASYGPDTAATVVGVALSDGDFPSFHDLKPLLITWRNYTYNRLTESPHVFQHGNLYYLFISSDAGQSLSFYTSTNPTADPSGWIYRGRLRDMLGFDTSTWFASEYFREGTRDMFCFVNGDRIEVREMLWSASWQFSLIQPPLMHVLSMDWEHADVGSGEMAVDKLVAVNPLAGIPTLEAVRVGDDGLETPVPSDSLGLWPSPQLYSDTTYVGWIARRYPAVPDSDTVTVTRYRFRCTDLSAQTGILTVRAPRPPDPPLTGDPPPNEAPSDDDRREIRAGHGCLRALTRSPLGNGPAVVVELEASATVRVDLFDLSGRRVRNLAWRQLPAGPSVLPWDGRDDGGRSLPRGIYFARLSSPGRLATTRVLLAPR
jgi:hypothetical protein